MNRPVIINDSFTSTQMVIWLRQHGGHPVTKATTSSTRWSFCHQGYHFVNTVVILSPRLPLRQHGGHPVTKATTSSTRWSSCHQGYHFVNTVVILSPRLPLRQHGGHHFVGVARSIQQSVIASSVLPAIAE